MKTSQKKAVATNSELSYVKNALAIPNPGLLFF